MIKIIKNIKYWLKNHWQDMAVALLAGLFFVAISCFNFQSKTGDFIKWSSPDETANYTFAKLYGQTGGMKIFEKYNLYAGDIIRPRSMRSDYGSVKPVSFLGIILVYGKIVSLTTYKILPFLTPFFAGIAIFFYYLLIKRLFGKTNAFLSSILLMFFPVWIYYSIRSMFHNVGFVSFLIIGLYFLSISTDKIKKVKFLDLNIFKINWKSSLSASFAGIFIGFAIIFRTSELLWIMPTLFIMWIFNLRRFGILKLLIFVAFLFLAISPVLLWNYSLYGGFTNGGYPEMNNSIREIAGASGDIIKIDSFSKLNNIKNALIKIKEQIFYFGFNLRQSKKMFVNYFIKMFPAIFYLGTFGVLLFLFRIRKWRARHFAYILSLITTSFILIFYYGSWEFYDNPDKSVYTIGNSYTRYWLPIYLGTIPFVSFFITKFSRGIFMAIKKPSIEAIDKGIRYNFFRFKLPKKEFLARSLEAIIIIIIIYYSLIFVLYGSREGIIYLNKNDYLKNQQEQILSLTESNSVIITQYHDKILFPERKVIVGLLTDNNMNSSYEKVATNLPLYYYNFTFGKRDFDYLNSSKLKKYNLRIEEVKKINESFTLYKIISLKKFSSKEK